MSAPVRSGAATFVNMAAMPDVVEFLPELTEIPGGLRFPEGPIAITDGSIVLVELFGQRLTRVAPDGTVSTVAEVEGGRTAAAVGPDGAIYLCNNGGCFTPVEFGGMTSRTVSIRRSTSVAASSGSTLTTAPVHPGLLHRVRRPAAAGAEAVMDGHGGFYFTDHGVRDHEDHTSDLTAIYYARADGSAIHEVAFPVEGPNGIGLSPDSDTLYWAETATGRVFRRAVVGPGKLAQPIPLSVSAVLYGLPGLQYLDSLAVDGEGWVCVATLFNGGITAVYADGSRIEHHTTGDLMTTNVCFGGDDLRTAYVTLSSTGRLVSFPWPRQGLRLAHQ